METGRDEEAERYTRVADELADEDNLTSQALWRWVRARVMARRGEVEPAVALAQEATDLLGQTDSLIALADAAVALSEVAAVAGSRGVAAANAEAALELYERKGDLVSAQKAQALVARLSGSPGHAHARI
jgi:ATP/maltotriose-dependent transcriptional regulator MalT